MHGMFTFSENTRSWVFGSPPGALPNPLDRLRVATYNVWFDPYEARRRCFSLLEILATESPDIIALQEVTQPFLEAVMREPWIRADYRVSLDHIEATQRYDVVMLSRLPARFTAHPLTTSMGRRLHVVELDTPSGVVVVAGCHLESMREMAHVRLTQIKESLPVLARADTAIWMGDFNAAPDTVEDRSIRTQFADTWTSLCDDPGYTRDTTTNKMLARVKDDRHQRIDRVFLRGSALAPVAMRMLGTEPLDGESDVFPSDHYGLCAEFERTPSP